MAYATHCSSIIRKEFFKPLFDFSHAAKHRRDCPALDDTTWLEAGVRRCLGVFQSGRDFLQQLAGRHDTEIGVSTLFEFKRREKRQAEKSGPLSCARLAVQRLTQRTVRFIRWLRNHPDLQRDWASAITKLARAYSRSWPKCWTPLHRHFMGKAIRRSFLLG